MLVSLSNSAVGYRSPVLIHLAAYATTVFHIVTRGFMLVPQLLCTYSSIFKLQMVKACFIAYSISVAKPILTANTTTIIKDQRRENNNALLTCEVSYAYPTPVITWRLLTDSSIVYEEVHSNFSGKYILYNNGSLEGYHRYILESNHLIVICMAANIYGSSQKVFHLWNYEFFSKGLSNMIGLYVTSIMCFFTNTEEKFSLYVITPNCRKLTKVRKMIFS